MKYLYYDLGERPQGSSVVAHLVGSAVNVILLDPLSFERYRLGLPFLHSGGGFYKETPVRLEIPRDGHWYLVIDCGGFMHRVSVKRVELVAPNTAPAAAEPDTPLVGANA
jgi:hypothetical protein